MMILPDIVFPDLEPFRVLPLTGDTSAVAFCADDYPDRAILGEWGLTDQRSLKVSSAHSAAVNERITPCCANPCPSPKT